MAEAVDITCPFCGVALLGPYDREFNLGRHFWTEHTGGWRSDWKHACFCGATVHVSISDLVEHWKEQGGFDAHLLAHQLGLTGGKP